MIKNLLTTALLFTSVGLMDASAQAALCTAVTSCIPSGTAEGICPDSATGLPAGVVNQAYTVTMSILIPPTVLNNGVNMSLTHLAVRDVLVDTSTSGTPAYVDLSSIGLTYLGSGSNTPQGGATGISGYTMEKFCYWSAPGDGCVLVTGTPNATGDFPIRIISEANVVVIPGFPPTWFNSSTSPTLENNNYHLLVNATTGIAAVNSTKFEVDQNAPNPFNDKTEIKFSSLTTSVIEFKVFNLLGSVVYISNLKSVKGVNTISLEANLFNPGVYMYSIKNGANTITKRMVVSAK